MYKCRHQVERFFSPSASPSTDFTCEKVEANVWNGWNGGSDDATNKWRERRWSRSVGRTSAICITIDVGRGGGGGGGKGGCAAGREIATKGVLVPVASPFRQHLGAPLPQPGTTQPEVEGLISLRIHESLLFRFYFFQIFAFTHLCST